jgi:deoxyribodipyrimidine photo-lyase
MYHRSLHWFRRDLREEDNAGLHYALASSGQVHCVFVFDTAILGALPSRSDRRVEFILGSVADLRNRLRRHGGDLIVLHGQARREIPRLAARLEVDAVFANGDYEPKSLARDDAVRAELASQGRRFHLAKDHAIFEKDEVLSKAGTPFCVFTPYLRAWRSKLEERFYVKAYPVERYANRLAGGQLSTEMPTLEALGFEKTNLDSLGIVAGTAGARALLDDFTSRIAAYGEARDFPAVKGVSYLGVHNRFGTVSVRGLARLALSLRGDGPATWLSELAWRDFFFQVLWHYPEVENRSFHPAFDAIPWEGGDAELAAWSEARTGYPIVDAAMRQLNATGFMHNRLRMVAASFLVKDLLVDWRHGERVFAERLNDYDLAANNGNWQWVASTGCDAQPWFRIFNPAAQSERFDPGGRFIRRYLPELARVPVEFVHEPWKMPAEAQSESGCVIGRDYPAPIVEHSAQRARVLEMYRRAAGGTNRK